MADLQASYDLQSPEEQAAMSGTLQFVRSMLPTAERRPTASARRLHNPE